MSRKPSPSRKSRIAAVTRWRSGDRLAHPLAAQVEVAVAQPHLLADLAGEALDLERAASRRARAASASRDAELELAGRQLGVDGLGLAARRPAPATVSTSSARSRCASSNASPAVVRMEDELDEPGAVAQVDEHEAAVVAAAVDPAGEPGVGVDPVAEHLAAPGVAVGVRAQCRAGRRSSRRSLPSAARAGVARLG